MTASTRRAALGAILAAPLTGGAVMALPSDSPQRATPAALSDHETRFLALIPQLRLMVPRLERAKAFAGVLYQDGDRDAGEHPGWSDPKLGRAWAERAFAARDRNGYHEAWAAWSAHSTEVDQLVGDFMTKRMTTLVAIGWKARVADLLDCWEEQAGYDLAAWAREGTLCA